MSISNYCQTYWPESASFLFFGTPYNSKVVLVAYHFPCHKSNSILVVRVLKVDFELVGLHLVWIVMCHSVSIPGRYLLRTIMFWQPWICLIDYCGIFFFPKWIYRVMLMSYILLFLLGIQVAMLKFTGYKLLNNISDSGKAFIIILVSDILLG